MPAPCAVERHLDLGGDPMTSKPTPSSRLKRLAKGVPSPLEVHNMFGELDRAKGHTGDRATAILGASFLDHALETVLLGRYVPLDPDEQSLLFDGNRGGPLSTFSSKIRVAYAMGIYGPVTRDDLNRIRDIRNAFAHGMIRMDFETKEVVDLCSEFELIRNKPLIEVPSTGTPKDEYISTVFFLWTNIRPKIWEMAEGGSTRARRSHWGKLI